MRWSANKLVTSPVTSLKSRVDLRDSRVDDRVARRSTPISCRGYLQLALVAVRGRAGKISEATQEVRRSSIHELDQIGEALIEVSRAESKELRMEIRRQSDLRGSAFFGAKIGAAYCKQSRAKLVERRRVESGTQRGANSESRNDDRI